MFLCENEYRETFGEIEMVVHVDPGMSESKCVCLSDIGIDATLDFVFIGCRYETYVARTCKASKTKGVLYKIFSTLRQRSLRQK